MLQEWSRRSFVNVSIATILDRFVLAEPLIQTIISLTKYECYTMLPFKSINPYLVKQVTYLLKSLSSLFGLKDMKHEIDNDVSTMCEMATNCFYSQITGSKFLKLIPIIGTEVGKHLN